ncbi:MAG: N-acetylmuramoyl-L-alanine amidase [Thermodesulfovibrionales bacterium]|jgi:N-acetylmuramoyl-L-alanine amidase
MGNYTAMVRRTRAFTAFFIFLLVCTGDARGTDVAQSKGGGVAGATATEVSVRFSRHEGFERIVFEASDELFIRSTVVTTTQNQIRVQFPGNLNLKSPSTLDIDTSLKGRTYLVSQDHPFTIKVLKLSSPPRLSIDIMTAQKEEVHRPTAAETIPREVTAHFTVVIDPGHGGYDLGIISGDLREKDISVSLARDMEAALLKKKRSVFLTRRSDQFLSIDERAIFAFQKSPDLFLSLHLSLSDSFVIYTAPGEPANAEESPTEFYSLSSRQRKFVEKSKVLAEDFGKSIKDEFKTEIIIREMSLPLLNSIGAPAVLIELPRSIVYDKGARARLTDALVKGILSYASR